MNAPIRRVTNERKLHLDEILPFLSIVSRAGLCVEPITAAAVTLATPSHICDDGCSLRVSVVGESVVESLKARQLFLDAARRLPNGVDSAIDVILFYLLW